MYGMYILLIKNWKNCDYKKIAGIFSLEIYYFYVFQVIPEDCTFIFSYKRLALNCFLRSVLYKATIQAPDIFKIHIPRIFFHLKFFFLF